MPRLALILLALLLVACGSSVQRAADAITAAGLEAANLQPATPPQMAAEWVASWERTTTTSGAVVDIIACTTVEGCDKLVQFLGRASAKPYIYQSKGGKTVVRVSAEMNAATAARYGAAIASLE